MHIGIEKESRWGWGNFDANRLAVAVRWTLSEPQKQADRCLINGESCYCFAPWVMEVASR